MVSVLIPVYNAEKTICRCLDSVLKQTFRNFEVIVVNDGSKDATLSILKKYVDKSMKIKVIDQPNRGVAAARNVALENAYGDYILYVDSDDWIEPNMIQRMLDLVEDADIVFCGNDHAETAETVEHISDVEIEHWNQPKQMLEFMKHKRMTGMLWNKLLRRSVIEGCHFNEKTGYGEDAEFLWKVLKKSQKMVVTNEILYHHVLEDTSISHLSFSDKKYSAIPMWESIVAEVEQDYPFLLNLAIERLMCVAVFSMYEMKNVGYSDHEQHIREIVKQYYCDFLKSPNVSKKMKLFATSIRVRGGEKKVSVIVPIYNTKIYLKHCLESIKKQTYRNIEVIMINDGSTDGSEKIANKFEIEDERFWMFTKKNAGVSSARNKGLDLATGDYVLFVDSDDWIEANMIEVLVNNIERSNADISCCQYDKMVRKDIGELEIWPLDKALNTFMEHKKINGSLVNKLIKKEVITNTRFDTSIGYGEDALFLWKILLKVRYFCITNKVLYHVVLHNDSASGGGSYKPIRRDSIRVWSQIATEANQINKEYGQLAKAQLANMAFYSLYEMIFYHYENSIDEGLFLNTLKENLLFLIKMNFISRNEKIMAYLFVYYKKLAVILIRFRTALTQQFKGGY